MNVPLPETVDPSLLFNWEAPRRRRRALIAFLGGSVLVHALGFYIFQIVYRPSLVLLPPPGRVQLITPGSEDGRALLQWVDAEDPALASATQRPPEGRLRALPRLAHNPSYLSDEPKLKDAPPLSVELPPPSPQPPGAVAMTRPAVSSPAANATTVFFSKELSNLGPVQTPSTRFSASSNEQPDNIRFRVALSRQGEIRYCFPLNSSGDTALDEQARKHLTMTRFSQKSERAAETDQGLIWGTAAVEWGNDIARSQPKSTSTAP